MIDVKNNYKFSIIISVYNVEKYIKESIESVINQSIGFIDNVELLLVDDGSTDNSKVICKTLNRNTQIIYTIITNQMVELHLLEILELNMQKANI